MTWLNARMRLVACLCAVLAAGLLLMGLPARAQAADPTLRDEILVKLTKADAIISLLQKYTWLIQTGQFGARPIFRLTVIDPTADVKKTIDALRKEVTVIEAEPNFLHQSPEARRSLVWAIGDPSAYTAQWAPQAIHLAAAQQISTGLGVRVAVLDTGIDATHPAFALLDVSAGRLLSGRDFVVPSNNEQYPSEVQIAGAPNLGFGHGTHVAGLIALVAPDAKIIPLRVLDPEGVGNAWVVAEAMLYAVEFGSAHVINLSLGSVSRTRIMDTIARLASCTFLDPKTIDQFADPGYDADKTRCNGGFGAVIIAAAGNGASDVERQYPAAEGAYGLMPVGASNASASMATFSNFGDWIKVATPGDGITSAFPGGGYAVWSGTSMASPIVAGVAALVRQVRPDLSAKDLVRYLAGKTSALCGATQRQIDAAAAVNGFAPADPVCPR